jgi:predicted CoA-binding protein
MSAESHSLADVRRFLGLKRIAFVGVSRDRRDFSRTLYSELASRGYDVVPVNPGSAAVEGRRCYSTVCEIEPPVEGALVMTPAAQSAQVVRECARAGIGSVWLYRGGGRGAVSKEAETAAREAGITLVSGECPLMFFEDAGWLHRLHGWIRRAAGSYPAAT